MSNKTIEAMKQEFINLSFDKKIEYVNNLEKGLKSSFLFWGDGWNVKDSSFDYDPETIDKRKRLNLLRYEYVKAEPLRCYNVLDVAKKRFYDTYKTKKLKKQKTNFVENEKRLCSSFLKLNPVHVERYNELTNKNGAFIDYGKKLYYECDLGLIIDIENALEYYEFLEDFDGVIKDENPNIKGLTQIQLALLIRFRQYGGDIPNIEIGTYKKSITKKANEYGVNPNTLYQKYYSVIKLDKRKKNCKTTDYEKILPLLKENNKAYKMAIDELKIIENNRV